MADELTIEEIDRALKIIESVLGYHHGSTVINHGTTERALRDLKRRMTPVAPKLGTCTLTSEMFWCGTCGRGICDGKEIPGYTTRDKRWAFCPGCATPIDWSVAAIAAVEREG